MIKRPVELYKRNIKDFFSAVLIHVQTPMARLVLSMIHKFANDVAGIAIRNRGVRQADTEVVFDPTAVINELECVYWHYFAPTGCECIEAHSCVPVGTVHDVTLSASVRSTH